MPSSPCDGTVSRQDAAALILYLKNPTLAWQNPANRFDMNGDGYVVAGDLLTLINQMNAFGPALLSKPRAAGEAYLDVSGDNFFNQLDIDQEQDKVNGHSGKINRTWRNGSNPFDVKITNIRQLASNVVGLEVTVLASLQVFGRESLWEHGVQLYSVSAEADARVRLWAAVEVTTHVDITRFPPDVALAPQVTAAKFAIPDFRIRRIGGFQGPVVRSLSHTTREAVEAKLAEDNAKLVAKLNRAIDKNEKKLRISLADIAASKWRGLVEQP